MEPLTSCDACGLSKSDPRSPSHDCTEIIKSYGRAELATEILGLIESGSTLGVIEERLRAALELAEQP